jgi:bifunctional UDP-N-acetylglucosamine pyrophosphorylase/glucosamine-1-phosphate N-acetyltransferase
VGTASNAALLEHEASLVAELSTRVVVQVEARGMGDAVLTAATMLGDHPERPLLVSQVHDVYPDTLLARLLANYHAAPAASHLVAFRTARYFPGGYFVLRNGAPIGLVEKPVPGTEPSDLVNIVLHVHSQPAALLAAIRQAYAEGGPDDHYERAIQRLIPTHPYQLTIHEGPWAAVKFPWQVLDVVDLLLHELTNPAIATDARIDPAASVRGNVVVEPGARLLPGAVVVGPAYIGRDAVIGNNTLIRHASIEQGAVVGFKTEVARSYIGPGCSFHDNYVGDSVLGARTSMGAGGITANLRQDGATIRTPVRGQRIDTGRSKLGLISGEGAFLGINASTMPGVKVGQQSIVGPGVVLYRDLADHRRVLVRQDLVEQAME